MCKGIVVENEIFNANNKFPFNDINHFDHVIYIGDGGGDYCATAKLRSCDYIFVRKEYCLDKILRQNKINANIHKWSNGKELLQCFKNVLTHIDF
jgi:pyridoxal phosphate phosphatase PHOSPHO2